MSDLNVSWREAASILGISPKWFRGFVAGWNKGQTHPVHGPRPLIKRVGHGMYDRESVFAAREYRIRLNTPTPRP